MNSSVAMLAAVLLLVLAAVPSQQRAFHKNGDKDGAPMHEEGYDQAKEPAHGVHGGHKPCAHKEHVKEHVKEDKNEPTDTFPVPNEHAEETVPTLPVHKEHVKEPVHTLPVRKEHVHTSSAHKEHKKKPVHTSPVHTEPIHGALTVVKEPVHATNEPILRSKRETFETKPGQYGYNYYYYYY